MDMKVATAVRREFRVRVANVLSEFVPARGERVEPQCDLYCWEASPDLTCYLYLRPDLVEDCFTVECACSPHHHFPETISSDFGLCDGVRRLSLARLRYGELLEGQVQYWLRSPSSGAAYHEGEGESFMSILVNRVDESIQDILEYALPFFRRCVERQMEGETVHSAHAELDDMPYTVGRDS